MTAVSQMCRCAVAQLCGTALGAPASRCGRCSISRGSERRTLPGSSMPGGTRFGSHGFLRDQTAPAFYHADNSDRVACSCRRSAGSHVVGRGQDGCVPGHSARNAIRLTARRSGSMWNHAEFLTSSTRPGRGSAPNARPFSVMVPTGDEFRYQAVLQAQASRGGIGRISSRFAPRTRSISDSLMKSQ